MYGTVVFVDLDNFNTCIDVMNWNQYNPNKITDFLTRELLKYVNKDQAVQIWGISQKRGTEEAILIFFQNKDLVKCLFEEVRENLETLAKKIGAPTSLSVGVASGKIRNYSKITSHSKKYFKKDPIIFLAYKALKEAKKMGGNRVIQY